MRDLDKDFATFFPKYNFTLKDFQKRVIQNAVEKDSTLCIMPTGGGKSAIYWMSAVEMKGITIVISPLTALIEEQAEKLEEHGYETLVIHGGVNAMKQMEILSDFAHRKVNPSFIFASPEKIATDGFFEYCLRMRAEDIHLVVIDEVHCVSQWGISFRPFYKRIPDFMDRLFGKNDWCRVLALTATLNPMELQDICSEFRIKKDNILKDSMLMRSEIQLHIKKYVNEDEKEEDFWRILGMHRGEKVLVYLYRKYKERGVEDLCKKAVERGYKADVFHGDMGSDKRMDVIEKYRAGETDVIFATNAFGMGIDIPDIRVVIHFMIPESAEQYYQEIGRAARDGNGANAYLLYSNKNIDVKRTHFIDRSFPNEEKIRETFQKIAKREGVRVLNYFEDDDVQDCLPYYIESGLVRLAGKGFSGLSELTAIEDEEIAAVYNSTTSKGFVKTAKTNDLTADELSEMIYQAVLDDKVGLKKALERWLVIDVVKTDISNDDMKDMLEDIKKKKEYKHGLLDYFVYLIDENTNSQKLHQEIARYLGMDKYQLERIYQTTDGNYVRSKSEVIICELLAKSGLDYRYEELLEYKPGKKINPDFTIYLPDDRKVYWEHVGLLGSENYDANWSYKLGVYEEYYPEQLYKTYESGAISKDAQRIIDAIKKL